MSRKFLFRRQDGGVCVITPDPKSRREDEGEEEWISRIVGKIRREVERVVGLMVFMKELESADLPSREFRNAWRANPDGSIRVDEQAKQLIIKERAKPTMEERLAALEAKQTR